MIAIPKFAYTRSPALMKAYRCIPCQSCGTDDGTVCGAHSNWAEHGKGRGIKASDEFCASLCFRCHYAIDQGAGMTASTRKASWTRAHEKTVQTLKSVGLWPKQLFKERA